MPGGTPSAAPASTASAASPTPAVPHNDWLVASPGGTAIARCTAAGAYLVSWSPEQEFRADHVHRGPAGRVSVQFANNERKMTLSVTCVGGVPQSRVGGGEDDHGSSPGWGDD
jgi:hypothetical protein